MAHLLAWVFFLAVLGVTMAIPTANTGKLIAAAMAAVPLKPATGNGWSDSSELRPNALGELNRVEPNRRVQTHERRSPLLDLDHKRAGSHVAGLRLRHESRLQLFEPLRLKVDHPDAVLRGERRRRLRVNRAMNVGHRHTKQARNLAFRLAGDPHVNLTVKPLALALHAADYTPR